LEEALKLFDLPKVLGEYEGNEVAVNIGRFGPYVKFGKLFISIPKDEDPMSLTLDRAIELIEEKKKAEANKYIKTFPENKDVQVLNGRYGPYIKIGKKNIKIPKDIKPEDLTLEQCLELAEKAPEKKRRSKK
jgi:DNA topoisomerase-1